MIRGFRGADDMTAPRNPVFPDVDERNPSFLMKGSDKLKNPPIPEE